MKPLTYTVKESSPRKDLLWSTAGSLSHTLHSLLLLAVVTRLAGTGAAGIFSLTFSVAQMMYMVGCFEMNNILVTETKTLIGVRESLFFRLGTNVLMMLVSAAFALAQGFRGEKLPVFGLLLMHMALLSLAELCESHLFRNRHLDLAGKSLCFDLAGCTVVFALVLWLTQSLAAAVLAMCCTTAAWILLFDIPFLRAVAPAWRSGEGVGAIAAKLAKLCLPLLVTHLVLSYIINAPKLAIDLQLPLEQQAYYGYLIMPAALVNLLSLFAVRPQMPALAKEFHSGEKPRFVRRLGLLIGWDLLVAAAVMLGGRWLGLALLELFYGVPMEGYLPVLTLTLLGGIFYAFATLFDVVATAMRVHHWNMPVYLLTAVLALTAAGPMVARSGLQGAAAAYALFMGVLALGSAAVVAIGLAKK